MNLNEDSQCRLCLSTNTILIDILKYQQLPIRINECLNIQIKETDNYPKTVCSSCLEKIESWYSFRSLCLKSQEVLKQSEKTMKNYVNSNNSEIRDHGSEIREDTDNIRNIKEVIKIEIVNENTTLINSDLILKIEDYETFDGVFDTQNQFDLDDNEYDTAACLMENIKLGHNTITCQVCSKVMLTSSFKGHMVSHSDRFKCPQCSHKFSNKCHLNQHVINVHTDIKNYICEVCSKRFGSKGNLNVHMKSHKETRDYKCNICDYRGRTNSAIYSHMFTHNTNLLSCMFCGKLYKAPSRVADHIKRIHMNLERKFSCSYCPKKFFTKSKLTTHERIHTGDRPFSCTICNKSFKRSDSLREHMGVHGLGRGVKCTDCSKNFVNKNILLKHKQTCKGRQKCTEV